MLPNLHSTLLIQLLQGDMTGRNIADSTRRVYDDYQATQMALLAPDRIYLIIDALDQCPDRALAEFV